MVVCMIFKMIVCHHHHYFHHYWWKASPASLSPSSSIVANSILLRRLVWRSIKIQYSKLFTSLFLQQYYITSKIEFESCNLVYKALQYDAGMRTRLSETAKFQSSKTRDPMQSAECLQGNGTATKRKLCQWKSAAAAATTAAVGAATSTSTNNSRKCNDEQEYLSKDCDFKCKFAKKRRFRIYSMFEHNEGEERKRVK